MHPPPKTICKKRNNIKLTAVKKTSSAGLYLNLMHLTLFEILFHQVINYIDKSNRNRII